ncbi:MAG: isoprenylcysteine carboxylmethyltransferase family protein [Opitutus sp.]|nr:isoprenylcysteine carboxylmethyltransferase family protein [Opitutus sp.]
MTARNVAVNFLYYGATVVAVPWLVLNLEDRLGVRHVSVPMLRVAAVGLAVAAAGFQLWCITLFQRIGNGTPSPVWPPRRLVRAGPYRWLRNPLNLGEVSLFVALAMWFGSPALMAYALVSWFVFHAFVVYYEEPGLVRRFGRDYEGYCVGVGRWWPRIEKS